MSSIEQILKAFFHDREYFRTLVRLSVPIALQNLITSSLNLASVMMIGQLGEVPVASVGLSNQIFFLLNLVVFGTVSGAAMFSAQLWGKKDIANIRRVMGLTQKLGLCAAALFWVVAYFFPETALRVYTNDPNVITLGSRYLKILSWSFGFFTITAVFYANARSIGEVRLPLLVSTCALALSILMAYPLIFGLRPLGIPPMGVEGSAMAILLARILECMTILYLVYRDRRNPIAVGFHDIIEIDLRFIATVMKPVLPVIANETLWSLGITTYNSIYGHIGTEAVAAINIISTIDQLAFVVFLGLGTATGIMVGNLIGQGQKEKAFIYAGRSVALQVSGAMLMGILVYFFAGNLLQFYKVSPVVLENARNLLIVLSCGLWIRASNFVIIIGILRAGGDTRFAFFLDGLVIWFVGVPITAAGAFLFHLPVYFVFMLTLAEEVVKAGVGLWRYFTKRWINDMTEHMSGLSAAQDF